MSTTMTPIGSPPAPTAVEPAGRYEVVGTLVVEKPPIGAFEAGIASLFLELLAPYARENRLGQWFSEVLFDLRPGADCNRRPDLAFVSSALWPIDRRPPRSAAWVMVPDLAVEVISPTNTAVEVFDKVREYLRAGTRLVWVVYPLGAEIEVYDAGEPTQVRRLLIGSALEGGAVLPGFRLELATLFAEGDPPAA